MKLFFPLLAIFVFALSIPACASPAPVVQTSSIEVTNPLARISDSMNNLGDLFQNAGKLILEAQARNP
jgi:hypothetical protein